MAANEAAHEAELVERRKGLFGQAPRRVSRDMLFDVEAPDLGAVRVFQSPRQAMEVALRSEEKAFEFFDRALPHLVDQEVKWLFEELRGEEKRHAATLRARMKGMAPGADVEEELADEPGSDPG